MENLLLPELEAIHTECTRYAVAGAGALGLNVLSDGPAPNGNSGPLSLPNNGRIEGSQDIRRPPAVNYYDTKSARI
jgi:hypothetical protein